MARFHFFLNNVNQKESPISLDITYNGKRAKFTTKQKIPTKAWNPKAKSVRANYTEFSDIQKELDRIEAVVKVELIEIEKKFEGLPDPPELKKILKQKIFYDTGKMKTHFWEYFEDFLKKLPAKAGKTGKAMASSTVESYGQTYKILKSYEGKTGRVISFSTLSNQDYDSLVRYLEQEMDFAPNTVGKHIKNLKTIISSAREDGIPISQDYREKYWRVLKQTKTAEEIIFLTEEELKELWEMDLSENKSRDKVRDVFLIGAWTGLRISDILNLTADNFNKKENLIVVRVQKTGAVISIPIHPTVKEILEKYEGEPPKLSEPVVNREIKIICSDIKSLKKQLRIYQIRGGKVTEVKAKKYNLVTTHAARRSFASNMFKKNQPVHQIMAITGHKKEIDFFRYIGVTNDEIAQAFNQKFKEWYK